MTVAFSPLHKESNSQAHYQTAHILHRNTLIPIACESCSEELSVSWQVLNDYLEQMQHCDAPEPLRVVCECCSHVCELSHFECLVIRSVLQQHGYLV